MVNKEHISGRVFMRQWKYLRRPLATLSEIKLTPGNSTLWRVSVRRDWLKPVHFLRLLALC